MYSYCFKNLKSYIYISEISTAIVWILNVPQRLEGLMALLVGNEEKGKKVTPFSEHKKMVITQ